MPEKLRVEIAPDQEVNAFVYPVANQNQIDVTVILGHGAGVDQNSDFMMRFATGLAARGINLVTFNFLYTEQGRRVPDSNSALEACFRAMIEAVRPKKFGRNNLVIGGKSLGGRIASHAGVEKIASSPTSSSSRNATEIAAKAPFVSAMSSGSKGSESSRVKCSARNACGSASLVLYANQSLFNGIAWRRMASTRGGKGISCGLPNVKSQMPDSARRPA